MPRTIHVADKAYPLPEFLREQLLGLPPDELWEKVFYALGDALPQENSAYAHALRALPPEWRAVTTVGILANSVNNGGFDSFFGNCNHEFDDEALEDLRRIADALPDHAATTAEFIRIYQEALALYPHETDGEPRSITWEEFQAFLAANKPVDEEHLLRDFFDLRPDLTSLAGLYIRARIDAFVEG